MINSMMLTFGPLVATYQGFNLKQFNAYGVVLFSMGYYTLSQVAKFIILAILAPLIFPPTEESIYSSDQEMLKAVLSMVEIFVLYYLLS